ncbi:MAG: autotransporter domain-containing protein [Pseudomonadota bacterium]
MSINFRKILLAGTALVAVSAFSVQAHAVVVAQTLTGSVTWAEDADQNQAPADGTGASASDTVDLVTFMLTVRNDQTADDGGGLDLFTLGAVTGTTGSLIISSDATGAVPYLVVNGTSVTISGAGNVYVVNQDTDDQAVTATFTGNVGTGGNLVVTNTETTTADDVTLNVGGTTTVTGTTGITAGAFAGATANVVSTGNWTSTGATTLTGVTGGEGAGSNATLTLNGTTNDFGAGGLNLVTAAKSILTVSKATAQTVAGIITGGGSIVVDNTAGVTFSGAVTAGGITIENSGGAATNSSATFTDAVTAPITLGGAGTGANTVTFDGTAAGFTVTGAIDSVIADETNNIAVIGGDTIVQATAVGGGVAVDNLGVSGTGTILDSNAAITLTGTTTIGTGATLDVGVGLLTSPAVVNAGTLLLSGVGGVTGTVDGSAAGVGTLSATGSATVTGNIGTTASLAAINVATTKTLTATGDVKATTTTLTGTGALALTAAAHNVVTNIVAAADGAAGAITIADGAFTTAFVGDIGTALKQLATLDVAAGAAATLITTAGDLYIDTITIDDGDVLTLSGTDATQTVSGTIDGGGSKGTLTLTGAGTQTIAGIVGGGGSLATVNAGVAGATATFSSAVDADTVNVTGTGTVAFAGNVTATDLIFVGNGFATVADGVDVTGNISNGTDAFGTITFAGDTTLTGDFGAVANELKALTLSAASGTTLAITGDAVAADTTSIAGNTVTVGGTFALGTGQQLNVTILTSTTNGAIVATGNATVNAGALLSLTVDPGSDYIATGDSWTIIDGGGGAGVAELTADIITGSALLTFTQDADTEDLIVTAVRLALDDATFTTNTANDDSVGAALDVIALTGGAELDTFQADVAGAETEQALSDLLESVTATVDGGAQFGALDVGRQTQDINDTRMAALRSGDGSTGVAAGASANGVSMWFQGYGQFAAQDTRQGIKGYDSDTLGAAVGVDTTTLADGGVLGFALSYGRTNIDGKNVNTTSTELDNYGITFYSGVDLGQQMFLNGQVGYAFNQIESDRHNVGGVPGLTANGDYHGNQFSMKAALGHDCSTGYGLVMTPTVSAAYTYLDTESYTETGAGALNLDVDSENMNVLALGVGMNASWNLKSSDGTTMKPSLRVGYAYNALDDNVQTTSSFTGDPGATAFAANGADLSRSTFNAGAGVTWMTASNWDVSASYDYTYKADYAAHNGVLRATSRF